VVWEGRRRETSPYPDQWPFSDVRRGPSWVRKAWNSRHCQRPSTRPV